MAVDPPANYSRPAWPSVSQQFVGLNRDASRGVLYFQYDVIVHTLLDTLVLAASIYSACAIAVLIRILWPSRGSSSSSSSDTQANWSRRYFTALAVLVVVPFYGVLTCIVPSVVIGLSIHLLYSAADEPVPTVIPLLWSIALVCFNLVASTSRYQLARKPSGQ
ncbi:MAG: hypothetical protein SGCHY_001997 [Lobulomycetales sp.]